MIKEMREWRTSADKQLALLNLIQQVHSSITYDTKFYKVSLDSSSISRLFEDFKDGVSDGRLGDIYLNEGVVYIDFDDRRYTVSLLVRIRPEEVLDHHNGRNPRGEFTKDYHRLKAEA